MSNNQTPTTTGGPLSFKTVPGRHRTQKWNTAPKNTYDGDDWGDYDPYDDYGGGVEEAAPPLPTQPSALPSQMLRKQSFDRGDDGARAVSSPFPAFHQAPSSAASGGRGSNDFPRSRSRPRDFTNPEQAPPPLRASASREAVPAPPGTFPPRKSSMGGNTYEAQQLAAEARAIAESVTNPAVSTGAVQAGSPPSDKPLPFIRPSDIYKRIEEERRRESEESGRPSVDTLERKAELEPVQEQRESVLYPRTYEPPVEKRSGDEQTLPHVQSGESTISGIRGASPTLPLVTRFSGFGDEILTLTDMKPADDAPLPSKDSPPAKNSQVPSKQSPPSLNTAGLVTASSSIQQTPISTRAPLNSDPAADILAERQSNDGLQHQPSLGFRSAVHQAFDQNDASLPSAGVVRSDTSSTAGISPIMSRVPSAATAAFHQRLRDEQIPSITEESSITPTASRPGFEYAGGGLGGAQRIARKPSPGQSRRTSAEYAPVAFEPGYRRSLDPPSSGTSPARTPALETVEGCRLSTPLSGVIGGDGPDVADQGDEVVQPDLHPAQASEAGPPHSASAISSAVPITGRGRSNTDYSVREADIADTINSSPSKGHTSPELAEAAQESRDSRDLFLRTHDLPESSPSRGARSDSPAKSRVREIAGKYQEIHDSRRNSVASIGSTKSGWSAFTDDGKQPKLKRATTGQSQLAQGVETSRPTIGREESFKPDVPGGWINSEAPTPAMEASPQIVTRNTPSQDEPIDLTPTTKKYQLQGAQPTTTTRSPIDVARDVGNQLGAALMGQYGVGHQTRDFASKDAPAPVDQSETLPKRAYGDVPMAPPLLRYQTDSTDAPTSVESSALPTPLAKDTSQPSATTNTDGSLSAGYFSTVAPLRVRSREASPERLGTQRFGTPAQQLNRTSSDSAENERIREEIVRSLDSSADKTGPTQDVLNAPDDEKRVGSQSKATPPKPSLLNTRFSWENSTIPLREEPKSPEIEPEAAYERPRSKQLHIMNPEDGAISPVTPAGDRLPEISGTAGGPLSIPEIQRPEAAVAEEEIVRSLSQRVKSPVSPVANNQDYTIHETTSPLQSIHNVVLPSISEKSPRLPSYYTNSTHDTVRSSSVTATDTSPAVAATSPTQVNSTGQSHGQIPAFRNILQIKDADDRIKTYNETRHTFADMNTGLGDWLQAMTVRHPDVLQTAEMGKPPPLEPSVTAGSTTQWKRGHRAAAPSMNLTGLKNRFASGQSAQGDGQGPAGSSGLASSDTAGGSGGVDLDRVQQQMQQKGKEFMKNAGVFGSKAGAGAKGLLAKGRSRLGGSVRGKGGEVSKPLPPTSFTLNPVSTLSSVPKSTKQHNSEPVLGAGGVSQGGRHSTKANDNIGGVQELPLPGPAASEDTSQAKSLEDAHDLDLAGEAQVGALKTLPPMRGSAGEPDREVKDTSLSQSGVEDVVRSNSDGRLDSWPAHLNGEGEGDSQPTAVNTGRELDSPASKAPTPSVVTALAAHIKDAETRSEAVVELEEAKPHLADARPPLQGETEPPPLPGGPDGQAAAHRDSTTLVESMHVPSAPSPVLDNNLHPHAIQHEHRAEVSSFTISGSETLSSHGKSFTDATIVPTSTPNVAPASASAFENRPDLSRQTSAASSVLAFKYREGSATPSSRSSRPLSGVFDRLRDKTRSWSRTRKEGSRSRPASLVLSRSNLLSDEGLQTPGSNAGANTKSRAGGNFEDTTPRGREKTTSDGFTLTDFSDVAVDPTKTTSPTTPPAAFGSSISRQRTEAWNEPHAQLPDKRSEVGERNSRRERLGVLPSPAPTATTFAEGERHASNEQSRRRSSAVVRDAWRQGLEEQYSGAGYKLGLGEPLDVVPSQVPSEEDVVVTREGEEENREESMRPGPSQSKRPQQQRKVSDIATLPSQQRRASESLSNSRPISLHMSPRSGPAASSRPTSRPGSLAILATGSGNDSHTSGLTDAEFAEASPVSVTRVTEPALLRHDESRIYTAMAVPDIGTSGSGYGPGPDASRGDECTNREAAQEPTNQGLGSNIHTALQHNDSEASLRPIDNLPRERSGTEAFASVIASATARKEKLARAQRPVEAQINPYVLSDGAEIRSKISAAVETDKNTKNVDVISPAAAVAKDKWEEDARSEISAEGGSALDNDKDAVLHRRRQRVNELEAESGEKSRGSSVSSIGSNAAAHRMGMSTGVRTSSGQQSAGFVDGSKPVTGQPPPMEKELPTSFATIRASPELRHFVIEEPMSSRAGPAGPLIVSPAVQQISTIGASPTTQPISPIERTSPSGYTRGTSQGLLPGVRPPSLGSSGFQRRFSERLYAQRPDMGERPLSYMQLPRDEGGYVKEEIDTAAAALKRQSLVSADRRRSAIEDEAPPAADISFLSGPPAGTPPFQQHPLFRNSVVDVQPTEYERMRSTSRQGGVLTSPGLTEGPASSSVGLGYFRDPQPLNGGSIPGRNVISDNHGLEDVHAWGETATTPREEVPGTSQREGGKHARRRGGIWNAFTNKRASSGAKLDTVEPSTPLASLENSESLGGNMVARDAERMDTTTRKGKKTLQKPQRASLSTVKLSETEPKKKRFSGLKSLLGRSSTSAGESGSCNSKVRSGSQTGEDKARKLRKGAPVAATPPAQYQHGNPATVKGGVHNYDEYERARKREMAQSERQPAQIPSLPIDEQKNPPADGWYGPSSRKTHQDDEMMYGAQAGPVEQTYQAQPIPDFRRLHSEGSAPERPLARVPAAFRPVEASFGHSVAPIGPPHGHTPPTRDLFVPRRHERHASDGTAPVSGRSEYYAAGQRPFDSVRTISPAQVHGPVLPHIQTQGHEPRERVISQGTEIARSPAKDYPDQQTPFAITLPGGSRPASRDTPWSQQQSEPLRYADAPGYQYAEGARMPHSPDSNGGYPPGRQAPGAWDSQGWNYNEPQSDAGAYPTPSHSSEQSHGPHHRSHPPYDWMSRQALTQGQQHSHPAQAPMYQTRVEAGSLGGWNARQRPPAVVEQQQQQQQQQPRRYYSHVQQEQQAQQAQSRPYHPGPSMSMTRQQRQFMRGEEGGIDYRRRSRSNHSGGYSGRRDDPAVGEDEVDMIMRGASYPGQEWDPWQHSGRR